MNAYTTALERIGGLSHPSKMPTASWSIPATACKLGSKLRKLPGTTCSNCYACKGCYTFKSTRQAMARRLDILQNVLSSCSMADDFVQDFATVLQVHYERTIKQIKRTGKPGKHDGRLFRWHDSGDLQSITHLHIIVHIAKACPNVVFWLPTREVGMVQRWLRTVGSFPPNLTVRLSLPRIDMQIPLAYRKLTKHANVCLSGVHTTAKPIAAFSDCHARKGSNYACDDCRKCTDSGVHVSYAVH